MGILALLAPIIPQLVTFAEQLFGHKTGQTKLDTVVAQVQAIINNLGLLGKLPGTPPPTGEIISEVSKVATQLYPPGTTTGVPIGTPVPAVVHTVTINLPDKEALKKLILWGLS